MSHAVKYPLIYEINTRVWLKELSDKYQTTINLSSIPISEVQKWANYNFNAVWLMGIWSVGSKGRQIAQQHEGLIKDYASANPNWKPEDILSSPFAIQCYEINPEIGTLNGLEKFKQQLLEYDIKLILDFVPNHTALDHAWVTEHPDYYVNISKEVYDQVPENYYRVSSDSFLAYGRDPYFPPWTDTLQLNYGNPDLQRAMIEELKSIAKLCHGVRCDMAMLMLKDIYNQVWGCTTGEMTNEFWDRAIKTIKHDYPDFIFIAEAYWDKEWDLQQLGFDFTYDKRFYDRLKRVDISSLSNHLKADIVYQEKLVRFIENHDEERAATSMLSFQKIAAMVSLTSLGMRLIHDGQIEGRKIKLPVQLVNRQYEETNEELKLFYEKLFRVMRLTPITRGKFRLLELNGDAADSVIAFERTNGVKSKRFITIGNFSADHHTLTFMTDAFQDIPSYEHVDVISTELTKSPQFDLSRNKLTVRLRPYEGLLFVTH